MGVHRITLAMFRLPSAGEGCPHATRLGQVVATLREDVGSQVISLVLLWLGVAQPTDGTSKLDRSEMT